MAASSKSNNGLNASAKEFIDSYIGDSQIIRDMLTDFVWMQKQKIWKDNHNNIVTICQKLNIAQEEYLHNPLPYGLNLPYPQTAYYILASIRPAKQVADILAQLPLDVYDNIAKDWKITSHQRCKDKFWPLQIWDALCRISPNQCIVSNKFWQKFCQLQSQQHNDNYICLDSGYIIPAATAKSYRHVNHHLRIIGFDAALFTVFEYRYSRVSQEEITQIYKFMCQASKAKNQYYDIDKHQTINSSQCNKYAYQNKQYHIVSAIERRFKDCMDKLQQQVSPLSFRLYETLQNIKNTPIQQYYNCDSRRHNKNNRCQYICAEYALISNEQDILKFWTQACQQAKLPKRKTQPVAASSTQSINTASNKLANSTQPINSANTMGEIVDKAERRSSRRKAIPQAIRFQVWRNMHGDKMSGPCFCCRRSIAFEDHQCGHIKAAAVGGSDTANNLRPICGTCNRSMSTTNMYEFMQKHQMAGLQHINA